MAKSTVTSKKAKTTGAKKSAPKKPAKLPGAFNLAEPSIGVIRSNLTGFLVMAGIPALLVWLGQAPEFFSSNTQDIALFNSNNGLWNIFIVLGPVATLLAAPGAILMRLASVRNKASNFVESFREGLPYVWRMFGLGVILLLAVGAAYVFIPFLIPLLILLPRVLLAPYYLVERNLGPIKAIKASMIDYKKYKGTWGIIGVFFLIACVNIIPFVGWALALVATFLYEPALAVRYEQIKALAAGKAPRTPIERKQPV